MRKTVLILAAALAGLALRAGAADMSAPAAVAQLARDEAAVRSGRVAYTTVRHEGRLPAGSLSTPELFETARKFPTTLSRDDTLAFTGDRWLLTSTFSKEPGFSRAAFQNGVVRQLREFGTGSGKVVLGTVGAKLDLDPAARVLECRGSELLQKVDWKELRVDGEHLVLTGSRGDETLQATLRTTPRYAIEDLKIEEAQRPGARQRRTREVIASYHVDAGQLVPAKAEFLELLPAPFNQVLLIESTVSKVQLNVEVPEAEVSVAFPTGIPVTDRTVIPYAHYRRGDHDPSPSELKTLREREARAQAKIGQPVADFELRSLDGKQVKLSSYRGKVVVLTWFASWCPSCKKEAPYVEREVWQKLRGQGVSVLGIDTAEHESPYPGARKFVNETGITFPVAMDVNSEVAAMYQVNSIPTVAVIDRKGVLQHLGPGFNASVLLPLIQDLLKK